MDDESSVKVGGTEMDAKDSVYDEEMNEMTVDIVVIGAGPGGYTAALHAAKLGASVALVEKDVLGGTCLNRGCIPTKALVQSTQVYQLLKDAESYGCQASNVLADIKKIMSRKDSVVQRLGKGIDFMLGRAGVKVINGTGEIRDANTVVVKGSSSEMNIISKYVIVATGSEASRLNIPGIDLDNVIGSTDALQLLELPASMSIVGGGVIGMEFAFIFSSLGVQVSVIEYLDSILPMIDPDMRTEITRSAQGRGIRLYTDARVEKLEQADGGKCCVHFTQDKETKRIVSEKVLISVGRKPLLEGIGVQNVSLELNEGGRGIRVNDKMQTSVPNIYAIGDVTNKFPLAHVAAYQGMVAVRNTMGKPCSMEYHAVPNAIFTTPQIAVVGMGEQQAAEQGIEVRVAKAPFVANGKALTLGDTRGFVKLVSEKR
jgi:dihydrolipoamide dehydrogenase